MFARLMGAPADRNLIDLSMDAGVLVNAPLVGRGVLGVGIGCSHVSDSASKLDGDFRRFIGGATPLRSAERFIEVTYQYSPAPWRQLQPDIQRIDNPGGGVAPATTTYSFTPTKNGEFRWFCVFPCDLPHHWAMSSGYDGPDRDGFMAGVSRVL